MDRQKAVIVALVAVAMLFVISLGVGAGRDRGGTDDPGSVVRALRGLQGKNFIRVEGSVTSTCAVSADQIVIAKPCEVDIPATGFFSKPRRAALERLLGATTVKFVPPDGPIQHKTLSGPDCIALVVDRHGGRLELTCSVKPCRLRLLERNCPDGNGESMRPG